MRFGSFAFRFSTSKLLRRRLGCPRYCSLTKIVLTMVVALCWYHVLVHTISFSADLPTNGAENGKVPVRDAYAPAIAENKDSIAGRQRRAVASAGRGVRKMAHEAKKKLSASQPGECDSYFEAIQMTRKVTKNILRQSNSEVQRSSVTLVTQLDSTRLDRLIVLARLWKDAISATIYVRNGTSSDTMKSLRTAFKKRRNIAVQLVKEGGAYYPVNFLRNVALNSTVTKYAFTTDIDFLPSPNLHKTLEKYLKHGSSTNNQVLIIPAFEQVNEGIIDIPKNKAALLKMWNNKSIKPFHFREVNGVYKETGAQGQTNFDRWKTAVSPYTVEWADGFEPYLAFDKSKAPLFNEMFVGRYFNKVTQSLELSAKGFKFLVLPDVYLIHQWHEATPWSDVAYRCSTSTLLALKLQVMEKYDIKLAVKNNMKFASMFYLPRTPKKKSQ